MASSELYSLIELRLSSLSQLFNSMDPSPFHERDLDHDAEQFVVSWAQEHPVQAPLKLLVHLTRPAEEVTAAQSIIEESVRHYFEYRAGMTRGELRHLLREGRLTLFIGVSFLLLCVGLAQMLPAEGSTLPTTVREGLTIIGWVAMWKPLDVFLYSWWPLRKLERIYRKLSLMKVEVRQSLESAVNVPGASASMDSRQSTGRRSDVIGV